MGHDLYLCMILAHFLEAIGMLSERRQTGYCTSHEDSVIE